MERLPDAGLIAAGVAEELANLLGVITGYCRVMERRLPAADPNAASVQQIQAAAASASALTQRLLRFAQEPPSPRVISAHALIEDMRGLLATLAGGHVELSFDRVAGPDTIRIDPGQLEQLLLHLILRTREAVSGGGSLLLRTGRRRPSPELAGELGLDSRECLVISVTRSALGIPAADLSGLLGLESRVEPRAAEQEYGLSAAFALVRQNGGGIQVFSRPSQGTKFEIYIPLCMDSDQPPPPATMQGWSSRLVLLAEDEVLVRELVHRILSENGFEVLDAADGLHALEVAEARNVPLDLVVTDVVMPGMSGIELARRITERYGEVPVLYMSGYLDRGEMKADLPAGAVLIHKPFKPDQFVRQVEELLQNRS